MVPSSWRLRFFVIAAGLFAITSPAYAVERGSSSMVTSIDAEDFNSSTITNLSNLIQNLPQDSQTFRGDPATPVSIRGLGRFRQPRLIIDGQTIPGAFGAMIPLENIQDIEVLSDGAAAMYGSDAVAGVINLITKQDFDGQLESNDPAHTPYFFNNLLSNQYLAIDSTQQCDYTQGVNQPAHALSAEKLPAESQYRVLELSSEFYRQFFGGTDREADVANGTPFIEGGTFYRFPNGGDIFGFGGSRFRLQPWFYYSDTDSGDFYDRFEQSFGNKVKQDSPEATAEDAADGSTTSGESAASTEAAAAPAWLSKYREGIPSWRTIELGYTPCSEADMAVLEGDYQKLHAAWADWSYHFRNATERGLSLDEAGAEGTPLHDAAQRRDDAKDAIREKLKNCPGPEDQATAVTADTASAQQTSGGGRDAAAAGEPSLGFGAQGNTRFDFRVQYTQSDGNQQAVENGVLNMGPRQHFPLPGNGAEKDPDSGHDEHPFRLFTDARGIAGFDLNGDNIRRLWGEGTIGRIRKLETNWAGFTGRTGADPRWGEDFQPTQNWLDKSSVDTSYRLNWLGTRFGVEMDLNYGKFDSRVLEFDGLGRRSITSPGDLSPSLLQRFGLNTRPYISDAFSIRSKLYVSMHYPEYLEFHDAMFDGIDGVTGHENNECASEALPPPGDPAFKARGSWGQTYDDQWAIKRVGFSADADSAWTAIKDSAAPVVIGIIDTGLDWHHLDINWDNLWRNEDEIPGNFIDDDGNGYVDDVIGWDFLNNANDPWDYDGHGTFVAGIIAADRDNQAGIAGINPNAQIMVLKALNTFGHTRASHIAKAIVYGVENGARILNLSVAGPGLPAVVQEAIDYATDEGVLVIAAAGNTGENTNGVQPAGIDGVVTVAATDLDDRRPGFSNYGTEIDIAAPGVEILSLRGRRTDFMWNTPDEEQYKPGDAYVGEDSRYYRSAGTSFAAPIVAGIASLVWGNDSSLTAADVRRILQQSARDIEIPGRDQFSGYGLVDARAALGADPAFFIDALITGVAVVEERSGLFLEVQGSLDANDLKRGWLEFGAGEAPTEWQRVRGDLKKPVDSGPLGRIPAEELGGAPTWTIRLIGEHEDGQRREYRFQVDLG